MASVHFRHVSQKELETVKAKVDKNKDDINKIKEEKP
jgi:hypothetical protein